MARARDIAAAPNRFDAVLAPDAPASFFRSLQRKTSIFIERAQVDLVTFLWAARLPWCAPCDLLPCLLSVLF